MKRNTTFLLAGFLLLTGASSCGPSGIAAGNEGGVCFGNGTCNDGLTCLSDRCVRWTPDEGIDGGRDVPDVLPGDLPDPGEELAVDPGVDLLTSDDDGTSDTSDADQAVDDDACVRDCTDRACGDDGCGGSCGQCPDGDTCHRGVCFPPAVACPAGLCHVPAGPFTMGSDMDGTVCPEITMDPWASPNELPCHRVDVPEFWIDQHEVTVKDYGAYIAASGQDCKNPSDGLSCIPLGNWATNTKFNWGAPDRDDHPINTVTQPQAAGYCAWAGKRLCTESEWEKAARGTDGRTYPWGNLFPTCELSVVWRVKEGDCPVTMTLPVGSRPLGASPFGALDMAGNVAEYVQDEWHNTYAGAPTDGSAWWNIDSPKSRIVRGGGWDESPYVQGTTDRRGGGADYNTGFRCCSDTANPAPVP